MNCPYVNSRFWRDECVGRVSQKWQPANSKETASGFTVQEWEGFNVRVIEVERDEDGNLIEVRDRPEVKTCAITKIKTTIEMIRVLFIFKNLL